MYQFLPVSVFLFHLFGFTYKEMWYSTGSQIIPSHISIAHAGVLLRKSVSIIMFRVLEPACFLDRNGSTMKVFVPILERFSESLIFYEK